MPLTLSGNGTISGLVAGGLPDGTIVGSDLASGAAVANIGYQPRPNIVTGGFNATLTGERWCRFAYFPDARRPYRVTLNTTGGNYSPSSLTFFVQGTWDHPVFFGPRTHINPYHFTGLRSQGTTQGNDYFLEVRVRDITSLQLGGVFEVTVESLVNQNAATISSYGTDASNLTYTGSLITVT